MQATVSQGKETLVTEHEMQKLVAVASVPVMFLSFLAVMVISYHVVFDITVRCISLHVRSNVFNVVLLRSPSRKPIADCNWSLIEVVLREVIRDYV